MAGESEGRMERALTAIGSTCLLVLMAIVVVDVAGRNLLNRPLSWGTEVLEVLLGGMVFAIYPVLALRDGHVVVDLVQLPRAARALQRLLGGGVGVLLFAVIAWSCGRQALRSANYGDASAILGIPTAWVLWGMAALAALSACMFAVRSLGPLPCPVVRGQPLR